MNAPVIDIHSRGPYPSNVLSNFYPNSCVFDSIPVASPEGFLQALKFKDVYEQHEICQLSGYRAKERGKSKTTAFHKRQTLFWSGREYDRHGIEYKQLIWRFYFTLSSCESFRSALLSTGNKVLTHSIGYHDPTKTILTEKEFVSCLMNLRKFLVDRER